MDRLCEFRIPKKLCRAKHPRREPHEIVLALMASLVARLRLFQFDDHVRLPKEDLEDLLLELEVSRGVCSQALFTECFVPDVPGVMTEELRDLWS